MKVRAQSSSYHGKPAEDDIRTREFREDRDATDRLRTDNVDLAHRLIGFIVSYSCQCHLSFWLRILHDENAIL